MSTFTSDQILPATELLADRVREHIPTFTLAAKVGTHPLRLGQLLNGCRMLTPRTARKIAKEI